MTLRVKYKVILGVTLGDTECDTEVSLGVTLSQLEANTHTKHGCRVVPWIHHHVTQGQESLRLG